jgi:hypothetical protein
VTGESIADPARNEQWKKRIESQFSKRVIDRFSEAFAVMIANAEPLDEYDFDDGLSSPDVVGAVYMDLLTGRSNKWNYNAQYFTPWPVALMMARMLTCDQKVEEEFNRQVKAVISDDPILEAMTLAAGIVCVGSDQNEETKEGSREAFMWWLEHAWPRIKPHLKPITVCEPCIGSGVMVLAFAACHPLWLSQIGFIQYFGQDVDRLCVEMAKLNLKLYGITPTQVQPMTLEALMKLKPSIPSPLAERYEQVLQAEAVGDNSKKAAFVDELNQARLQQASLFTDIELRPASKKKQKRPSKKPPQNTISSLFDE